jgi:hypothetical protein
MVASLLLASADDTRSSILFWVFLLIFIATAVITLLGIIGKAKIPEGYLKKLFYALLLEVVGVIIALAKSTLTPTPPTPTPDDYQVWTVMGQMDQSQSHLSPSGVSTVAIAVLPQPAMHSDGTFDFYVAARRTSGTYELPTVQFADAEAKQYKEIHLDAKWDQYNDVKIDRDDKNHLATIKPFSLSALPKPPANIESQPKDASSFRSSAHLNLVTASNAGSPAPSPAQSP